MLKWIKRIALGALALLVAVVVAVVLWVRTESFRVLVRDQLIAAVDASVAGDVRVAAVEGSIWRDVTLRDVRLAHGGEDVLAVPEVRLGYALGPLVLGRLDITSIEIVEPAVHLRRDAAGVWNLTEALASTGPAPAPPAEPAAGGGLPIDVSLESLELGGGRVDVVLEGEPRRSYALEDLVLAASARLGAGSSGVTADAELSGRLTGEEIPPVEIGAAAAFEREGERTRVAIPGVDVRMPASAIHLGGSVADLAALDLEAELRVERLAVDEMRRLLAGVAGEAASWPLAVDLAAVLKLSGERRAVRAELAADAGSTALRLDAEANLNDDEPVHRTVGTIRGLAPAELLGRDDLGGVLTADLDVAGTGTELRSVVADVALRGEGLRVAEADLGDLAAQVALKAGEATVGADLVGSGRARLDGKASLDAETYDVRLEVADLDLGRIGTAAAAGAPPSELDLTAHVAGEGFALAGAAAKAEVEIGRSRIGEVTVDRGEIAARVADGRVHVDAFDLRAAGAVLRADGEAGLASDADVRLAADLRVPALGPWLALVGQTGSGAVAARASVRGPRDALAATAAVDLTEVRAAGVEIGGGRVEADLSDLGAAGQRGEVRADLRDLAAGVAARTLSLRVDLEGATPLRADVALDAVTEEGAQRLRAAVSAGEATEVELREVSLSVPTGGWTLDRPARIVQDARGIAIDGLRLSSANGGSLAVDGSIPQKGGGGEGLAVRVAALELAPFEVFAGEAVDGLAGVLEADLRVRGSLEQVEPSGQLRLRDGRATVVPLGVTIEAIGLETRLTPERIDVVGLSARAGEGRFDLDGSVGLRERQVDEVDLHLAIANWPAIDTDVYEARVAADVDVTGPLTGPTVGGRIEVLGARLRPPLSLPGGSGPPPRDESIVVVQEVREQQADEGGLATEAAQESDVFRDSSIDLDLVIHRGTWVEKGDDSALELAGEVEVEKGRGERDVALVGDVRVVRGWLYLYGRRFAPERGIVTFTGGRKIDPLLDVELQSRVSDYLVKTIVTGTASEPKLAFESEPELEDADVLALLMFGRPIHDLGEGEKVALEQQVAGVAGGYVAGQLGRALGDALGVRISELDVTKGLVGVGRYVTPDTYVSVTQSVSGNAGRQVQVEHYVTPRWTVRGQVDAAGESGLDVFWRRQY